MNRREFIHVFTQTSLVGAVGLTPSKLLLKKNPVQIEFHGKLLKSSVDGQILSSNDMGLNWDISVNCGEDYQIRDLYQRRQYAYAIVMFKGHRFVLRSIDGAAWLV